MRIIFTGQGRTRVCGEADMMCAAGENLRRTPTSGKKAIYGWTLGELLERSNFGRLPSKAGGLSMINRHHKRSLRQRRHAEPQQKRCDPWNGIEANDRRKVFRQRIFTAAAA
jgi:hypothetical protein